jgi:hypothetical protein
MTRRVTWTNALLGLLALAAFAWVAIPIWLIQPFAPQTPGEVSWSYALKSRAPLVTLLFLLAAILVAWAGRRALVSWVGRSLAILALVVLAGLAWLARQNHFEWMFNPLPEVRFAAADAADWVAPQDFVLGVVVRDVARAYPVQALAYHHVVNDVVADEPIVATY